MPSSPSRPCPAWGSASSRPRRPGATCSRARSSTSGPSRTWRSTQEFSSCSAYSVTMWSETPFATHWIPGRAVRCEEPSGGVRMNRRLVAALAAALFVTLLPGGPSVPRSVGAGPAGDNVLRVSINGDVTMNPLTFPQQLPTTQVIKVVFNTLTKFNPGDLKVVPDLATLWTQAENGRIWVFKLRRGVKWHDGRPFSAADVKFTFDAIVDPRNRALFRSTFVGLQSVQVIDDFAVRFEFDRPYPSLPIVLGFNVPIIPRHLLEGKSLADIPEFIQKPIGTGPYRWKEYVEGSHITLDANTEYWAGRPPVDTVVVKILPEINTVVAQLRTGELDLGIIEPVHTDSLKAIPHLRTQMMELPSAFYIALNATRAPLGDKKVRQALMYGLNRPQIF